MWQIASPWTSVHGSWALRLHPGSRVLGARPLRHFLFSVIDLVGPKRILFIGPKRILFIGPKRILFVGPKRILFIGPKRILFVGPKRILFVGLTRILFVGPKRILFMNMLQGFLGRNLVWEVEGACSRTISVVRTSEKSPTLLTLKPNPTYP